MTKSTIDIGITLETLSCANCGMTFAFPEVVHTRYRHSHDSFYCPVGHQNYYPGKSDLEKVNAQLESTKASLVFERNLREGAQRQREAVERSLAATRGVVTKLKKRVGSGVCPCCNRHFSALERHMATKHPDFVEPVTS